MLSVAEGSSQQSLIYPYSTLDTSEGALKRLQSLTGPVEGFRKVAVVSDFAVVASGGIDGVHGFGNHARKSGVCHA